MRKRNWILPGLLILSVLVFSQTKDEKADPKTKNNASAETSAPTKGIAKPSVSATPLSTALNSSGGWNIEVCVPGKDEITISMLAKQSYDVTLMKDARCDSRGWSHDSVTQHYYGPEGFKLGSNEQYS